MSIREDWVRVNPPISMGEPWTHDALITFGPSGEFRIVDLADLRVPPGTNGPYR